ncbi:MAG: hypothetical protein IJ206_06930 [Oscillospiraceae bacterium]|nr:hypothetical protein [Oscillospiraceae bacterium]
MDFTLCPEEKMLPYARFMDLKIDRLPEEVLTRISAPPLSREQVLPIGEISRFYRHGLEEKQFGFCLMEDGSGYLAHYLHIPDLTMEDLGWWFSWHIRRPESVPQEAGNLRYKIWCPPDHWDHRYVNGTDDGDGSIMVESLDMGAGGPVFRSLTRSVPLSMTGLSGQELSGFVRRHTILQLTHEHSEDAADRIFTAIMQPHPESGVILMSRVWWGYRYQDGQFFRDDAPGKRPCTEQILRNNLLHSSYEFNHLRKLLPLLRAELGRET